MNEIFNSFSTDDAVLQYSELAKLPSPNTRDVKSLQEWMERPSMGGVFLIGRDRNVWKDDQDLIALQKRPQGNQFSLWLTDTLTPLYHSTLGRYHRVSLI